MTCFSPARTCLGFCEYASRDGERGSRESIYLMIHSVHRKKKILMPGHFELNRREAFCAPDNGKLAIMTQLILRAYMFGEVGARASKRERESAIQIYFLLKEALSETGH